MWLTCPRSIYNKFAVLVLAFNIFITLPQAFAAGSTEETEVKRERSRESVVPTVGLPKGKTKGFEQALQGSNRFFSLTRRGDSYLAEGEVGLVVAEYKKALKEVKLRPDAIFVRDRLAKAYEQIGDYKSALAEVKEIAYLWPTESTKGQVLERISKLEAKAAKHRT